MSDQHTLYFMGQGDPEAVRARVYSTAARDERADFLDKLAGEGVIDCPAYDAWTAALQARLWLPAAPELEPNPDGPGRLGRWRLTDKGRDEWARIRPEFT